MTAENRYAGYFPALGLRDDSLWFFYYNITFCYWILRDRSWSRNPHHNRDYERDRSFRGGGGGRGFGQPGRTLLKPKWDLSKLTKFEKNLYVPHPVVANRPQVRKHTK